MEPHSPMAVSRSYTADSTRLPPRREEWRSWPFVRGRIPNLPKGTTTYDIQKNLQRFGKVEYIRIDETRQGNFATTAIITFKPPPPRRAPWDPVYRDGIDFRSRNKDYKVKVLLARDRGSVQLVNSPVRRGVSYPPELTLIGTTIDFGYLERKTSMVIKATRDSLSPNSIRLILNLKRLEMEVHFPINMQSRGVSSERAYRFPVALDDRFSMCEVRKDGSTTLVMHLRNPPWYSRQLKEAMQISHDPKSSKWSADDTWSRQTDIVDDKATYEKIDRTPVTLLKSDNTINIARWTTFRITISESETVLRQFVNALMDFNVPVTQARTFTFTHNAVFEAPVWRLLNGDPSARTFLEQLSTISLRFDVRYQLEVCISNGWLNEYILDGAFLSQLAEMPPARARQMLIHVDSYQERVYNPMDVFSDLRFTKPVRAQRIPSACAEVYHATLTPTTILFHTASVEPTNRILRKYHPHSDRFLRVRFEDDSYRGKSRIYPAMNGRMKLIFDRVRRTLRHGITLGDRHYEFLAWGNSQLREHGAWFFAATHGINADMIRQSMGTFDHERVVAKRAARMGQCFSTTKPISVLSKNAWKRDHIPDIIKDGHTFTDGVGKISLLAAQMISSALKLSSVPSAFQFRLGGCKGVLTLDPSLPSVDIKIRPSQFKFSSESDELEIIRVSQFWQPFLNRQLILVLSDLGVPDQNFLRQQDTCIRILDRAMADPAVAARALRESVDPNQFSLTMATILDHGFSQVDEPFVASILRLWRAWTLKYLKEKAKIPVAKGAFVLGVADETDTLRGYSSKELEDTATAEERIKALPEIFVQYTDKTSPTQSKRRIVEGLCIIARNPSLHRGDIRVVNAIDVPHLRHLCDVLVMPTNGERGLPSMCSGGDLDGDDYVVIWDPDLIPPDWAWAAEPFHYNAPKPKVKEVITTEDITDFFCDYMQNDFLGRIAHAHLAAADYLDDGIRSEQCLKLVELHSTAVDYPKTGVPAKMDRELERNQWPHFMEKKRSGEYHSRKILGKLYDAVERVKFEPHWAGSFDERILAQFDAVPENVWEEVSKLKKSYDESLRRIMAQHQIKTEFEIWTTFVLHHSKAARDFKFHEEIGQHSRTLKEQYYEAFCLEAGGHDFEKLRPFAIAAYHLTHREFLDAQQKFQNPQHRPVDDGEHVEGIDGDAGCASGTMSNDEGCDVSDSKPIEMAVAERPFISFPWVLQDVLLRVAGPPHGGSPVETAMDLGDLASDNKMADEGTSILRHPGYLGVHLSDPYVPTTSTAEPEKQEIEDADNHGKGVDKKDEDGAPEVGDVETQVEDTKHKGEVVGVEIEAASSQAPSRQKPISASLSELPPLQTAAFNGLKIAGEQSSSENGDHSSGRQSMPNSVTSTPSTSTSPAEITPSQLVLKHSEDSGCVKAVSPELALPVRIGGNLREATGQQQQHLKDPALMTEGEAHRFESDEDEDFAY